MLRAPSPPPEPDVATGARARTARRRRWPRWDWEWRGLPRWVFIAVGTVLAVLLLFKLCFGPIVRTRIAKESDRRRLDVEVGSVSPGFFAISLRDVRIRARGVTGVEARIDEARVDIGLTLRVSEVAATGGGLFVEGDPDEVLDRLRAFRRSETSADGPTDKVAGRGPVLAAENLTLSWKLPSGGELTGSGIRAVRDTQAIKLGCGKCAASHRRAGAGTLSVDVTGADVELALDGALQKAVASAVTIGVVRPPSPKVAPPSTGIPDLAPPPLPLVRSRGPKTAVPVVTPPKAEEPLLPLPDLHALRTRIATAAAALSSRLPEGGKVEIGGLSAKLDFGSPEEAVAFGPGSFTLTRHLDRVHLGFESASTEEGTAAEGRPARPSSGEVRQHQTAPLSIDADLPVGAGDITARLAGGPVSLAMLGIAEGMRGLTDVSHGTVSGKGQLVLSAAADALTFDGKLTLRSISMKQPRIALDPLRGIDFSVSARGVVSDAGKLRVDDAELDMGALHVKTHGVVEETADHFALALALDVDPASCQSLLDSSPHGLLPVVRAARMGGSFGASVNVKFDTRTIDKLALDYKIDDQCTMLEVPRDLAHEHFAEPFTYRTYHPDGTIGDTTTGPGSPAWTDLDDISPFMIAAVLTTEDGAFYKHKGFNHSAIRSSVQANLKARRFVRGASTISMQLAKNLFLSRDKALARKIEELVLTDYLEQSFRKDEMMELYLNVVEFGPDVYGITQAADYYFGRKPEELSVAECFFLASLLPSPIRYGKLREKGEVSETWGHHLKSLMEIAGRNGRITSAELEDGLKQPIVFVRSGDPRPAPRKPVTSRGREGQGDDAAWRPLE